MADPKVMKLLAAIADGQPCDRLPDLTGVSSAERNRLMGIACRVGCINVHSFLGDVSFTARETLTPVTQRALRALPDCHNVP